MTRDSFLRSTVFYTAGNLFSRSLSFLLLPFYSHYIGAADYGTYALIMSFYTVMAAAIQLGLQHGFTKYYFDFQPESRKKDAFSTYFNSSALLSFIICFVFFAGAGYLSQFITGTVKNTALLRITLAMNFIDSVAFVAMYLLKTLEQSRNVFYYTVSTALLNFLLNSYFVFYKRLGIEGMLLSQLITGVFLLSALMIKIKQYLEPKLEGKLIKRMLVFSLPVAVAGVLADLTDVADRFILSMFMDRENVGIYSFSYRIAMIMNVAVISFRTAWTPYSLRIFREEKETSRIFGENFNKLAAASLGIFLIISMFADDIFSLNIMGINLINPQYAAGASIIPYIVAAYIFSGLAAFYSVYPFISNKSYHFLAADAMAFGINVVLNFFLIPLLGITGAAISTLAGYLTSAFYLFYISKGIKINYNIKPLLPLVVCASGVYFLSVMTGNMIVEIAGIMVFGFVFWRGWSRESLAV